MSFVGTRPEAVKYVEKYKPEYMATLLLPAGITSEAKVEAEEYDNGIQECLRQDLRNICHQSIGVIEVRNVQENTAIIQEYLKAFPELEGRYSACKTCQSSEYICWIITGRCNKRRH